MWKVPLGPFLPKNSVTLKQNYFCDKSRFFPDFVVMTESWSVSRNIEAEPRILEPVSTRADD